MNVEEILRFDDSFKYQLLGRMVQDCKYYLGNGNRLNKYLWADNPKEHIEIMKMIYRSFTDDQKPEWVAMKDIENFERKMCSKMPLKPCVNCKYFNECGSTARTEPCYGRETKSSDGR